MGAVIQLATAKTLPLTRVQEKLWRYIRSCRLSPSYDEMREALGYASKGPVNILVCQLKERGFVDYLPNRRRTIVALDPREDLARFRTVSLIAELERRGVVVV